MWSSDDAGTGTDTTAPDTTVEPADTGTADTEEPADTSTADADPPAVPRATCEAPIGGDVPLLIDTSVEAAPGFDEALAAFDPETLPDPIDLSKLTTIHRSIVAYMLEIDLDALPDTMPRDEILATEPMGRSVLLAFSDGADAGVGGADLVTLRRGLHRFYQRYNHTATRVADGRVVVIGGFNLVENKIDRVEVYDPTTNGWTETAPLPKAREEHTTTWLGPDDDRLLVIGGREQSGNSDAVFLFAP